MRTHKIKANLIYEDQRLNAGYFLNEDALNSRQLERNKKVCVFLEEIADVWNPPIFKRQFCQNTESAVQYCQSSDVTNLLEGSNTYILKSQAEKVGTLVEENQILVTGFGTIGNTKLVNEIGAGVSFANNVCRIRVKNNDFPYGYIYAFMSSKYGRSQLNKNASGSVVRYIEAPGIKKTLIPLLSKEKQAEIHQLIVDAAKLRVEANRLLTEAHQVIEEALGLKGENKTKKVSILDIINSHQKRFEADYYNARGSHYKNQILKGRFKLLKELAEDIFRPGIFKRNYVEQGTDFLGGSDITKMIPDSDKRLARTSTSNYDDLVLKEDWILVTCGGTIGTCVYVNEYLSKKLASQHILRVIPKDIKAGYLFSYLSSAIGEKVIQSFTYGSVIPQIEPHHLGNVPVPLLEETKENEIHNKIMTYKNNLNESIIKEKEAISLIEKEIDLWQNW